MTQFVNGTVCLAALLDVFRRISLYYLHIYFMYGLGSVNLTARQLQLENLGEMNERMVKNKAAEAER